MLRWPGAKLLPPLHPKSTTSVYWPMSIDRCVSVHQFITCGVFTKQFASALHYSIGDVSYQWQRVIFKGLPAEKPLDREKPRFAKIIDFIHDLSRPAEIRYWSLLRFVSQMWRRCKHFCLVNCRYFFLSRRHLYNQVHHSNFILQGPNDAREDTLKLKRVTFEFSETP